MEQKAAMLDALRDGIVRLCSPLRIYVYNQKTSTAGEGLSSLRMKKSWAGFLDSRAWETGA